MWPFKKPEESRQPAYPSFRAWMHARGVPEGWLTHPDKKKVDAWIREYGDNAPLRPYFLENKEPEADIPISRRQEIMITAEMMADFFEHIWAKRDILPYDVRKGWIEYIISRYKDSPAIRKHLTETATNQWYSRTLLKELKIT